MFFLECFPFVAKDFGGFGKDKKSRFFFGVFPSRFPKTKKIRARNASSKLSGGATGPSQPDLPLQP